MDGETRHLRGWLRSHLRFVGLSAITGLAALAAVALATVPDGNGVIHTCYQTVGGPGGLPDAGPNLRVIDTDAGQICDPAREAPLNFNQQGPAGPVGAQGPPGQAGAAGPPGESGGSLELGDCPAIVGHVTLNASLSFDACVLLRVRIGARGASSGDSSGSTEYEITRVSDQLSPQLLKAAVQGTVFKTATIQVYKPGTTTVAQTFKLSDAVISSLKAGLGQMLPTEVLRLIGAAKKGP